MTERSNEQVVRAYVAALVAHDHDATAALRHRDLTIDYPQSGERIRGPANMRAIEEHFPGGLPEGHIDRIIGSEDRWVTTPSYTIQRVAGGGDAWWVGGLATYPDGSTWHLVLMLELRDGLIHHATEYYAAPFEAAAWRAQWVEPVD
jgi:hypothetical protein